MKITTFILLSMIMVAATIVLTLNIVFKNDNDSLSNSDNCSFRIIVIDSSVEVFDNNNYVGTVKLEGELDSLITDYVE